MTPRAALPEPTPAHAALVVGCCMLVMTLVTPFAEFGVMHRLVVASDADHTTQNILSHRSLFVDAILCYVMNYVLDVLIAWGLYVLLAPVNRALALLAAWFRLIYTVIGIVSVLNLISVLRLLSPPTGTAADLSESRGQVMRLLSGFRDDWSIGLLLFGIHLGLVGYLVWRSGYIPRLIGALLVVNGAAWVVSNLQPFLFPGVHLDYLSAAYFAELLFMLWLLIRGARIEVPFQRQDTAKS